MMLAARGWSVVGVDWADEATRIASEEARPRSVHFGTSANVACAGAGKPLRDECAMWLSLNEGRSVLVVREGLVHAGIS